jgi:enoyl-CoA hydratase
LTGDGEKAFVAGADIKEINTLSTTQAFEFAQRGQKIFRKIEKCSVPVVAAVNGFALGGGFELALSCDWIIASENAKFGLPEVSLGIIPGFGGTVRLARLVGTMRARQLIFSGDMFTAAQAGELGLALNVVPQAQLLEEARNSLKSTLSRGPLAVAHSKKAVLETLDADIDQAMRIEALHFSELFRSADMKEGTGAFIEKRKPAFQGV